MAQAWTPVWDAMGMGEDQLGAPHASIASIEEGMDRQSTLMDLQTCPMGTLFSPHPPHCLKHGTLKSEKPFIFVGITAANSF